MINENIEHQKKHAFDTENMKMANINDIRLAYEIHGTGDIPLVMVHGSWVSCRNWDQMLPHLVESVRVVTYDRRGHGESEKPVGQGSVREDVADLASLIEHLGLAPVWVAGQSFGGSITLRLAAERPDLLRGIIAHEPPLFSLVADDPSVAPMLKGFAQLIAAVTERIASGDHAGAAEQFIEEGLGEGLWAKLPPWFRHMMSEHATTYLDETNDPEVLAFDLERIRGFTRPALLTLGDQTAPVFPPVITKLDEAMPSAEVNRFRGAGHPIMVERPKDFAQAITNFIHYNSK